MKPRKHGETCEDPSCMTISDTLTHPSSIIRFVIRDAVRQLHPQPQVNPSCLVFSVEGFSFYVKDEPFLIVHDVISGMQN
jgi:hypothetical protein